MRLTRLAAAAISLLTLAMSTVGDMYRWHTALAGTSLLSNGAKDTLFRRWVDEGGGSFYGQGWSIEDTPFGQLVTHNGGNPFFFSDFLRYVDRDVVVYFSTNSRDRAMRRLGRPLAQVALTGRVPDRPAPAFTAVAAASSPAPAGSVAARWKLPAGSAAEAAARLLVPEVFAASLIERRGADALAELFGRMNGNLGGAPVSGYDEARDRPRRGPDVHELSRRSGASR